MDDFFDGCLGATARLAERDRSVEYQRCVLPSGQASAIEVEDAADLGADQSHRAVSCKASATGDVAADLKAVGSQRRAVAAHQLSAIEAEVTADTRADQAHLPFGGEPVAVKDVTLRFSLSTR